MTRLPRTSDPWEMLPPHASGTYEVLAGYRQFMQIDILRGGHVQFLAYQSAPRQNGSPRLFILKDVIFGSSLWRGGTDYTALYASTTWFRIEDASNEPDIMANQPYTWAVEPGTYFLCLQNMENANNSWTIQFDD